jgi:hypothetical protein
VMSRWPNAQRHAANARSRAGRWQARWREPASLPHGQWSLRGHGSRRARPADGHSTPRRSSGRRAATGLNRR